jgi:DNA-binding CsgD family transcriptional regulator
MSSAHNSKTRKNPSDPEIIRVIYASLLHEDHWSRVLPDLTLAFNATYSVVLVRGAVDHTIKIAATDALPIERQRAYEGYYSKLMPKTFFDSNIPAGHVLVDQMYEDYEAYLGSELYNDFFRPLHADHLMFLMVQCNDASGKSLVLRKDRKAGAFCGTAIRRFRSFGQHLTNRERILSRWSLLSGQETNFRLMMERLGVAALVVDRNLVIRHMTIEAERLLRKADVFTGIGGRLGARNSVFGEKLKTVVRDCSDSLDLCGRTPWRVVSLPMPAKDPPSIATVRVSAIMWAEATTSSFPAVLLVINDPAQQGVDLIAPAARLFRLTPAEVRVTEALCQGRQLTDYAKSSGVSVQTVRTVLKRVFAKTGAHSQSQLVSMIMRGASLV